MCTGLFPCWRWEVLTMRTIVACSSPTTSIDQYGATMAKWFGVGAAIPQVFPNIANFPTADVGFMG